MIADLKPYAEYKESGQEWIGKVPDHWEIRRLRASIKDCVNGVWGGDPSGRDDLVCVRVADFDRELLRVSLRKKTMRSIPASARVRRLLQCGDLLLEKSGGGDLQPVGAVVAYTHSEPAVCSNFVARMPIADGYNTFFVNYLHSTLYSKRINVLSIKQTTGIQNLDGKSYLSESVAFPPPAEQAAIVRFLDHWNGRLEKAIRSKRRVIALLQEQKQAIIHRAVTRGLDPNVKLKDSGIPWLGEIPVHWESMPNRANLKIRKKLVGERSSEYTLLSLTMRGVIARDMENPTGKFPAEFDTYQEVRPGDLIFCLFDIDETPRGVGISRLSGMITGAYTVFEPRNPEIAEFLYLHYLAMDEEKCLKPLYTGLRKTIPKPRFLGIKTPVPPPDERIAIVRHIKEETLRIDTIIARYEREIGLLREYRTRLTADVVTGKLDVRTAAAQLPAPEEEPAELEALEEEPELEEVEG